MKISVLDLGIGNSVAVKNWLINASLDVTLIKTAVEYIEIQPNMLVVPGACNSGSMALLLKETGFHKPLVFSSSIYSNKQCKPAHIPIRKPPVLTC